MKIVFIICIILNLTLFSRENPFKPNDKKPSITQGPDLPQLEPKLFEIPKPRIEPDIQKVEIKEKKNSIKISEKAVPKILPIKKIEKKQLTKPKKKYKVRYIYKNKFTKIMLLKNSIKIITKDNLINDSLLISPRQMTFDFERFDVVKKSSKYINSTNIKHLLVGYHGYYYKFIFTLKSNKRYKISKKRYGYLITLF